MKLTKETLKELSQDQLIELVLERDNFLQSAFREIERLQESQIDVVTSKNL